MRKILGLVLTLGLIFGLALPVLADSYGYYIPISITEIGGNTPTGIPILVDLNNQRMVDLGYLGDNATDTRMKEAGEDRAYMVHEGKLGFLVPGILAYQEKEFRYYTSYDPDAGSFEVVVGPDGYITVSDHSTLELGNNSIIEQRGWVTTDNGSDKNLNYKQAAFRTYISGSENITSAILGEGAADDETLDTDGDGDYTNITSVTGASTHWEAVHSGDAAYVHTASTSELKDAYTLDNFTITPIWDINSVTIYFRIYSSGAEWDAYAKPYLRLNGVETAGTTRSVQSGYLTSSEILSRPGGGSWTIDDLNDLQAVVGAWTEYNTDACRLTWVYIVVNYNITSEVSSVTATGISSGLHTLKTVYLPNQLDNSNFESGDPPTNWTASSATIQQEGTIVKLGSYSMKITANGAWAHARQVQDVSTYAGENVTIGAWVRADSSNDKLQRIVLWDQTPDVYYRSATIPKDDTWYWITLTVTLDPASTNLSTQFRAEDSGIADTDDILYVDSAVLIGGSELPESGNFMLFVDGSGRGAWSDKGAGVPNNLTDWALLQNDVMPYMEYLKMSVNGTQQLWFQPNDMISGTTLPDRATSVANDGTITWGGRFADSGNTTALIDSELTQADDYWNGYTLYVKETTDHAAPEGETSVITDFTANVTELVFGALTVAPGVGDRYEIWDGQYILWGSFQEGIKVKVGPMTAYTNPVSSATGTADPTVVFVPPTPGGIWGGAAPETLPLYTLFNETAIQLGWTAQVLYVVSCVGVSMGLGVVLLVVTGSVLIGVAMVAIGMFWGTSAGILPLWMILVYAVLSLTWMYIARSI